MCNYSTYSHLRYWLCLWPIQSLIVSCLFYSSSLSHFWSLIGAKTWVLEIPRSTAWRQAQVLALSRQHFGRGMLSQSNIDFYVTPKTLNHLPIRTCPGSHISLPTKACFGGHISSINNRGIVAQVLRFKVPNGCTGIEWGFVFFHTVLKWQAKIIKKQSDKLRSWTTNHPTSVSSRSRLGEMYIHTLRSDYLDLGWDQRLRIWTG